MKKRCGVVTIGTLAVSSLAFAGDMGSFESNGHVFVGLGGSYNSVALVNQKLYGKGVSQTFNPDGIHIDDGSAAGYSVPFNADKNKLAPQAQAGYFKHFLDSALFWGGKFSYQYLAVTASNNDMTIAQSGGFINTAPTAIPSSPFTGNYVVQSVQTSANHDLLLLAFVGKSFKQSDVYLGVGPSLFGMQNKIYNLTGYADLGGVTTNISGAPANFSGTAWVWGGAAQLGMAYHIDSTWFLDFNYTYALTARNTMKYSAPFTNVTEDGNTQVGTSFINSAQHLVVQSVMLSMNKVFSV